MRYCKRLQDMKVGDIIGRKAMYKGVCGVVIARSNCRYVACDGGTEYLFVRISGFGFRLDSIRAL